MKKFNYILASTAMLVFPVAAHAQFNGGELTAYLGAFLDFINTALIPLIIGIGFLVFVWGMFQYFIAGGANDEKKEKGKSLMIYATLGFLIIIIFWGLINLLSGALGLGNQQLQDIPTSGITIG